MREAELHDYYFGSVQSRAVTVLPPEERGSKREIITVSPLVESSEAEPREVLRDEKRSCNPLRRFASRS
jgi:hypothetical protein